MAQRGRDDQRVTIATVMAVAGEQPHPIGLSLLDQAIAVVLDFVNPFRPVGDFGRSRWDAWFEWGFSHVTYLGEVVGDARPSKPACTAPPVVPHRSGRRWRGGSASFPLSRALGLR